MSPALVDGGILSFLALLVLLLAMMLYAVIRMPPPRTPSAPEEDGQPALARPAPGWLVPDRPAHARPAFPRVGTRPAGTRAGVTSVLPIAGAMGQPGQTDDAAGLAAGPAPGQGTARRPTVSGSPPWDPAPKPAGPAPDTNPLGQ